mmetsp:Transcript_24621/g.53773  ORF Transcript_24621/g.53773 Transcript_24621/m.53773 type:complete len:273 (+) Transcript_24621:154-972(+)
MRCRCCSSSARARSVSREGTTCASMSVSITHTALWGCSSWTMSSNSWYGRGPASSPPWASAPACSSAPELAPGAAAAGAPGSAGGTRTSSTSPSVSVLQGIRAASSTSRIWSPAASWKPRVRGWNLTKVPFSSLLYATVTGPVTGWPLPHRQSATLRGSSTTPSGPVNSSTPACVEQPPGVVIWNSMGPFLGASWSMRLAPTEGGSTTLSCALRMPRAAAAASSEGAACSVARKYTPRLASVSASRCSSALFSASRSSCLLRAFSSSLSFSL